MPTALLHDGAAITVTAQGDGPAILLPVSTALPAAEVAEQILAWGVDPQLGRTLATGLAEAGLRVITADYEGHLTDFPKPRTLTADAVAADLLAIADSAGAARFAYYGYSWLALSGLQLAIRTDRLTALAMGGFPPLDGPYAAMLTVTRAAHRLAEQAVGAPPAAAPEPGDWDNAEITRTPEQTQQYVTLYESLQDFDEQAALAGLGLPRLAFAGSEDAIAYGPRWGDTRVAIGEPLAKHHDELVERGWTVRLIPGADHLAAMQASQVLPILIPWLREHTGC